MDRRRHDRSRGASDPPTSPSSITRATRGYPQAWRVDSQLGVGSARARAGDWTIRKGDAKSSATSSSSTRGALDDLEMTAGVGGVCRQPIAVRDAGAVGHRPARRTRGQVPDARAGGRADDGRRRLPGRCVGGRADDHAADGVLLGRSRPAVGRRESRLRVARARLLERRQQPHPDSRGHRSRRRRRLAQGVHGRDSVSRRRSRSDSAASSSARHPICSSSPTRTATTRRTSTTSRCA